MKALRKDTNKPVKTNIRAGKNDFLIRVKDKNSNKKWSEIAPYQIKIKIPDFNVGVMKDTFETDICDKNINNESQSDKNEMIKTAIFNEIERERHLKRKLSISVENILTSTHNRFGLLENEDDSSDEKMDDDSKIIVN